MAEADPVRPSWVELPAILGTEIDAALAAHPALVIHFWAEWNGYDLKMSTRLVAIRGRFDGRAAFCACDIDREENYGLCHQLRIVQVPWVVVFVGGKPTEPIVGLRDLETLSREIESRLAE